MLKKKINDLKQKKSKKTKPMLKILTRFALVPVEKAANNITIICKRCYVGVTLKDIKL